VPNTELKRGTFLGAAAMTAVVALMFALRLALGVQALPDVAADALTLILPGGVFGYLIDRLQEYGRPSLIVGVALGLIVLGALAGAAAATVLVRRSRLTRGAAIVAGLALVTVPIVVIGGSEDQTAPTALATIGYWILFTLLLELGRSRAAARPLVAAGGPSRRALLYGAGALGAVYLGQYLGGRIVAAARLGGTRPTVAVTPPPAVAPATPGPSGATAAAAPDAFPGLTGITTTQDFYVISKNGLDDPSIDPARWRLQVQGERPYSLGYDELQALPATSGPRTLECISNIVGGSLISTAVFSGAPLRDLLARSGVPANTTEIRFTSADGYTESIPLGVAMDPSTIVAYRINDQPLPKIHGFPARVLMSGRYGVKNPKWLTRIEPVPVPYSGYWPQRGWNKDAFVRTFSRLDTPQEQDVVPAGRPFARIRGVAFAGARGISRVEISFDNGATWADTTLRPILPKDDWMPFTYTWPAPTPGTHDVVVRATDGDGVLQDPTERDSFPDGATGYHHTIVRVA
jgi:DMSO/TMAO reductase YedYZ molybdopterin-dependent catalytic subunit